MPDLKSLTVFISYSRESAEHVHWVRRLADTLERFPDFQVVFDQYDLHAGMDLNHFMDNALACDRIIIVITPTYVQKASERIGGVGYESGVISADLLAHQLQDRFIPVLRHGVERPTFLRSKLHVDFRSDEQFERAVDDLRNALLRIPEVQRPRKVELASGIDSSSQSPRLEISKTQMTAAVDSYIEAMDPDFTAGIRHFRDRRFTAALSSFRAVVRRHPGSSEGRYYLVLCALSGRRPKLLPSERVAEIEDMLGDALATARDSASHIRHLLAIIRYDCYTLNGFREPSPTAKKLLEGGVLLKEERASELTSTISAPGNPIWEAAQLVGARRRVGNDVVDRQ